MKRSNRNRFYQAHVYACALTTIVCVLVIVIILLQVLSLAHSKSADADTANTMDKGSVVSSISVLQKKDNSPDAISRSATPAKDRRHAARSMLQADQPQ